VNTSLGVAHALGQRLWGVRVDTSEALIDKSVVRELERSGGVAGEDLRGVTPRLIEILRTALDAAGYGHVRIVASGGFDAAKIAHFERLGVPVDVYGVGSALVHGSGFDHTADIVRVDGRDVAKVGRGYTDNPRLQDVDWRALVGERVWEQATS
jgi:nicotinate phosphoribosyltransferase